MRIGVALFVLVVAAPANVGPQPAPAVRRPQTALAPYVGAWSGSLTHEGETIPFALELEPTAAGAVSLKVTIPIVHLVHTPLVEARPELRDGELRLGPFSFRIDPAAGTLNGTLPEGLVPYYRIPFTLRRASRIETPARPAAEAPLARPVWTFAAGTPLWAGATCAQGLVLFGGDDGVVHAVGARNGAPRWSFRAGGAIRTRATVAGGQVYVSADDGFVYRLTLDSGEERWRARLVEQPIVRLPFDDPKTRFDRFGADVTVDGGRLYVGTHDGRVVALDAQRGARLWEFATGGSVLGAPAVASGRVYAGSFDGWVYALDAATGAAVWKRDTHGAVVSTPAIDGERLLIGNRAYDLLALDTRSGEPAWKRYLWFSWVESSAAIRDGVAYVGSSDAAAVSAFEVRSGRQLWKTDVYGWAWGQPLVSAVRVYVGTASTPGYLGGAHHGGALALDRSSGRAVWRFAAEPGAASASYGFPGTAALGEGLVFFAGLDGQVHALPE
jgi:outer membrane protein assembly factor BamB